MAIFGELMIADFPGLCVASQIDAPLSGKMLAKVR